MKKQLVCALLCGALCLTPALAAGVEEKFPAVAEYPGFADVAAGSWYEAAAITCYEVGLMKGTNLALSPARSFPGQSASPSPPGSGRPSPGRPFPARKPDPGTRAMGTI